MSENKLYVGNVSFNTTDEQLVGIFSEFGTVGRASIVMDRDTGRSRGFAFVEMSSAAEANAAVAAMNGQMVDGRSLNVSIARPKESGGGRGFGGGGGGYGGGGGGGGYGGGRGGRGGGGGGGRW